ncbi:hypothetical protein EDB19DRAFT_1829670 [Suillus lakei]|nr:hypothetical protein EDB19DRAFT_1829670 [Suillus lakei]
MAELSTQWKGMTMEEQELAMDDLMLKISEQCEVKELAVHNVPLHTFHDSRKTLESMDCELEALHTHMGMEILLFTSHQTQLSIIPYACPSHVHPIHAISILSASCPLLSRAGP